MIKFVYVLFIFHICFAAKKSSLSNETTSAESIESNEIINGRIIGGTRARKGEFPFIARLTVTYSRYSSGICTGTVLSDKIILTAAHCLYNNGKTAEFALAQVTNQRIYFTSQNMFIHPNYTGDFADDVAVLKILRDRYLINYFGVAPSLPTAKIVSDLDLDRLATVAGWGKTSDRGRVSHTLQYANVNTLSNELCRLYFGDIVTSNVMCTMNQGSGICGGDSGGPLMITRNGKQYIVGINAFGAPSCEAYFPSGYTFVLPYNDWIMSVSNN